MLTLCQINGNKKKNMVSKNVKLHNKIQFLFLVSHRVMQKRDNECGLMPVLYILVILSKLIIQKVGILAAD